MLRKTGSETALDRIDLEIIGALQKDARTTNKELAALVGLAPSSCHERLKRLLAAGVVRGFRADVDHKALGVGLEALVSVRLKRENVALAKDFPRAIVKLPEVVRVFHLAGRTDLIMQVAVRDAEHLRALVIERLAGYEEVSDFETSLIFEHFESPAWPVWLDVE